MFGSFVHVYKYMITCLPPPNTYAEELMVNLYSVVK